MAAVALVATAAQASTFELVSRRSDGSAPTAYTDGSDQPAVTPDGRYVVFMADATNLVTPNAIGYQIYLRDRVAGTTELVSVNTTGGGGNTSSSKPSISDDGCRVVFTSFSSNLVAGDAIAGQDVFVRNRCTNPATTSLVSVSSSGTQANTESFEGRISADGSKVAFTSYATNLATMTGAGTSCLFRRDLNALTTAAITTAAGKCIEGASPDLSGDGSRVAYWAVFAPGTTTQVNGVWQIYVYDFNVAPASRPTLVSTSSTGSPQTQGNESVSTNTKPAISRDGGYVAFRSRGQGLTADAVTGTSHVYLKDLATGAIVLVSKSTSGALGNADSAGSGGGDRPALSDYAGSVSFLTSATNLASETGGIKPNIVTHDQRTGVTTGYVDKAFGGNPAVSAGGTFLVAYAGTALDATIASRGMFIFGAAANSLSTTVVAAVLPSSRSVQVSGAATAFATILNTGPAAGIGCAIAPATAVQATFGYQTTDPATNTLTGTPNTPANIPAAGLQTFVIVFAPTAPIPPTDVRLNFQCTNSPPAAVVSGLNTLLLSASTSPVPDIVALSATLNGDGIVNIPGITGTGVFSIATVNVGAGDQITALADTGSASLPVSISLCQTNPGTGQCISSIGSSVPTQINAGATPTFGIFVTGTGTVPFDPANNRISVRFKDGGGVVRGSTSVAVRTQ